MYPATRYFVLSPERLNETLGRQLATHLTRENIWNCILTQSGKYKGLKFGINSHQQALLVNDLIGLVVEQNKVLKQDKNELSHTMPH